MPRSDHLDRDKIAGALRTKLIGRNVLVYKCTSSTNDIAAEYASNKDNDGLVVFAEEQTAGRGRARRKWFSDAGDSILCSILLTRYEGGGELLSLASAVAVAEADHADDPVDRAWLLAWAGSYLERISPEAPVPVVRVASESWVPGGAANVAHNIRALGGEVALVGVANRIEVWDLARWNEFIRQQEEAFDQYGRQVLPNF